ncbi:F-box/WD repeat-containing protein 4-like isoform X1 [Linepithema humile]|uniref:F-box/WD repeat-containing protein 4-like isoform X1 n=1 Tax=Linepithema humile TaxID=83485 RepID=UPI00351F2551
MSFLYNLPNELLIVIFRFCDVYTLSQISMVCKQFCHVSYMILNEKANQLLVTNQVSEKFSERCKPLLSSYISKFITHCNWNNGIYDERKVCEIPLTFTGRNSGLQMTKNAVVFHRSESLMAYNRTKNGTLEKKVVENCNSIIEDITYCNDVIISSHRDGSLRFWRIQSRKKNTNYLTQLKISSIVNDDYIYRLDATSQHIILSCQFFDATEKVSVKIQKNTYETDGCVERNELFYRNHSLVTSILFDPIGTKFAANIIESGHCSVLIYDIDKSYQVMEKKYDDFFGLLLWEDPHTILTLNKGYIKKIDMRTSEFVHICDTSSIPEWGYDNLTCFSSDYLYTIMTGTRNGKVILWDQRKSAPIQMYQMSPTKPPDSYLNDNIRSDQYDRKNIRSIQFDSTHLYAVTYETLIEFDFKKKDYLDHENIKNILLNYF